MLNQNIRTIFFFKVNDLKIDSYRNDISNKKLFLLKGVKKSYLE